MNDAVDSQQHIGTFVNDGRRIAGTHTYGRLAGGVSGLHHAGAACCQDNVGFLHGHVGQLQAGYINPADNAFRCTGGNSSFQHNLGGSNGAALGTGVGADDDAVAGLQGKQGLEDGCRGGVGGGNDGRHNANRLGNLLNAVAVILFDDTAGLGKTISIVNVFGSKVVLNDLIFHHAHAGFFHGQLGQRNPHFVGGNGRCLEDLVDLFLCINSVLLLRCTHLCQNFLEGFDTVHNRISGSHVAFSLHVVPDETSDGFHQAFPEFDNSLTNRWQIVNCLTIFF